jgi:hypothetical protein
MNVAERARIRALEPLAQQVERHGSFEKWSKACVRSKTPNRKFDQVKALQFLDSQVKALRDKSEEQLNLAVTDEMLSESKKKQIRDGHRALDASASPFDRETIRQHQIVRLSRHAEWAFESWANLNGLPCQDLNSSNPFDPQDYMVCGKRVDVKTTISVGPSGRNVHWLPNPDDSRRNSEIICGVSSWQYAGDLETQHSIRGILDRSVYELLPPLRFFRPDNVCLNPCYFQPPAIYFGRFNVNAPTEGFDSDVLEYCVDSRLFPSGIFWCAQTKAAELVANFLPPNLCNDFSCMVAALLQRNSIHLLPHYLAEHYITKIMSKSTID